MSREDAVIEINNNASKRDLPVWDKGSEVCIKGAVSKLCSVRRMNAAQCGNGSNYRTRHIGEEPNGLTMPRSLVMAVTVGGA